MKYDVFISHASEDKDTVARPLAAELENLGLKVWFDECQLTLGDSLRRKIDDGLSNSTYGVVVLSRNFFSKEWPNKELDGLVSREDGNQKIVLPVWHDITASEVTIYSPLLASKLAISTSRGLSTVANSVMEAVHNASGQEYSVKSKTDEYESELLSRLRNQLLLANSGREIRQSMYELDEHLARYPHSPDARMLKDQMSSAMERTRNHEISGEWSADLDYSDYSDMHAPRKSGGCWFPILLGILFACFLIYGFLNSA